MNPNSFLTKSLLYDWIPDFEFMSYDLSDLVVLSPELELECKIMEDRFPAFLAIYKKGTIAKPKGLCTTFKYANLDPTELDVCQKFEKKLDGDILVAYSKPLQRW
ncbi:hypothetical protein [Leptospira terpstrae]|uniref:Uncharacterized protein n=1 Tax=Leptospira terpstrae serovar Hualin str. LT 11-33 = ATCC 700639 TaxID=1257025 RepID=N1VWI9_9LEPT|nr:hypothetical protein [Leptospira terpstrae]EMY59776.1 hypothetical protein LEP1GSC203_0149 [Leptospira terpstrae serovar Hualin str. LT 11-33 = ATCC 700639]